MRKYLGSVVPYTDNYYATLNSAVFSDGSFVYIPKGVRCPMELSTYFRINNQESGQFERTLVIAEEGAYVSYLEGCTAPKFDKNQLHAAVVELIAQYRVESRPFDCVFVGVTVGATCKAVRANHGIILCSLNYALPKHSQLAPKYIGCCLSYTATYFAATNSAVLLEGSS